MQVFAVACSESAGQKAGVVLYAPTLAQAFEATEEVLRERVVTAHDPGLASAFGDALMDLLHEGPQGYGWWDDVDGYEVWYGPVTANAAAGVAAGELALLASVTARTPMAASIVGAPDRAPRSMQEGSPDRVTSDLGPNLPSNGGDRTCGERNAPDELRPCSGLRAQGRLDGPDLRAGRLGVAVRPHRHGGGRVGVGALSEA